LCAVSAGFAPVPVALADGCNQSTEYTCLLESGCTWDSSISQCCAAGSGADLCSGLSTETLCGSYSMCAWDARVYKCYTIRGGGTCSSRPGRAGPDISRTR